MTIRIQLSSQRYFDLSIEADKERLQLIKAITNLQTTKDTNGFTIECGVCYWEDSLTIYEWFKKMIGREIRSNAKYLITKSELKLLKNACQSILNGDKTAEQILPNKHFDLYFNYRDMVEHTHKMLSQIDLDGDYDYYVTIQF